MQIYLTLKNKSFWVVRGPQVSKDCTNTGCHNFRMMSSVNWKSSFWVVRGTSSLEGLHQYRMSQFQNDVLRKLEEFFMKKTTAIAVGISKPE
ncbi:hypothetical protein QE152_g35178 [Popillia japonica]|uniref:Uncharacterized protein n=1 Tax=Popillia japonica TaxID=7064 RepID=A0AAW1IFU3_POPJA